MPPDQTPPAGPPQSPTQAYDFIVNPPKPPRKPLFSGETSALTRIAVVGAGLIVLLIIFVVLKNIIAGPPKLDSMVTVAQDQQELLHLTSSSNISSQQQTLSTNSQNLAATTQISVGSAQSQLISYMSANGLKIKPKVLSQKVSSSIDSQLSNAATAGTYDQTFQETLQTQLKIYSNDMALAYKQVTGRKGRALLTSDYKQAQLLLGQINTATQANAN